MTAERFKSQEDLAYDLLPGLGFEQVLDLPFIGYDKAEEHFFVYAHRTKGLLLRIDTYGGRINSAKVFYNWRPTKGARWWEMTSSGHMGTDNTWTGDHDARWGLRFNLDRMEKNGAFVSPWIEDPFIWLLHYGDTKDPDYNYRAINAERMKLLPDWVQAFATKKETA